MKKFLLFFTILPLYFFASAQISGSIVDSEDGDPLIGVTVLKKGTSVGTVTDINGQFQIEASLGDVLVISFIGYIAMELEVSSYDALNIAMKGDVKILADVVVVGTRGLPRTDVDRPVPVDVVSRKELLVTGQTDLGQMVQFTAPSFNSAKYGVNGTTNYADPAQLKGLGPDQSLVLVNGKRRHQFSTLQTNVAPGLGNVVTDLNSLPSGAVKRMEVLRDGAAAQYGSDAIAGIINIVLDDQNDGGTFTTTVGGHHSSPDDAASSGRTFKDGFTVKNSLNYGFSLGKESSFLNFTLEHFKFAGTNRSDYFSGTLYPTLQDTADYLANGPNSEYPYLPLPGDADGIPDPRADRNVYPDENFVVGNYGSNENETVQLFVNMAYPLNDKGLSVYAFGGYSDKDIIAYGFFREASRFSRAVLTVHPDGYLPTLPGESVDYSGAAGIRKVTKEGWNHDLSFSLGHNDLQLWNRTSTNPSLGPETPTSFYVGQYWFEQYIASYDISKNLGSVLGFKNLNFALGSQFRIDQFKQFRGSPESYEDGGIEGKDVGSSARPGIGDVNDIDRSNLGFYVDAEADITNSFLVTTAVRFENYSDFGANLSGKLATRYKLTDQFAIRGSYNRGFRAPSLSQLGTINNTSTVQNGQLTITRQVPSTDLRLAELGVEDPEAEISNNYNLGLTAKFMDEKFLITLDAYQIDINDRIVISERLRTDLYPNVATLFPDQQEIRFFTNHIDTQTRGLDAVLSYRDNFGTNQSLNASIAASFNGTNVVRQKDTPSQILDGAAPEDQDLKLLGQVATELIEVAVPRQKILFSTIYTLGKVSLTWRMTRFGEVKAFSNGLSDEDSNVECEDGRCVQTFAAKVVTDLSAAYRLSDTFTLSVGSNNIFDVYPDKYNNRANGFAGQASSYANGQIPYSRNSNQFGFNGRYLFFSATMDF